MNAQVKTMNALVRRELWEHRGFWTVPAAMASLFTLLMLRIGYELLTDVPAEKVARMNAKIAESSGVDSFMTQTHVVATAFAGLGLAIFCIVGFVATFYLLDSLYGDRRDRSILFWRSMPVTDVQTVLSKVGTALLAGPATTLGVLAGAFVVWGALGSAFALAAGLDYWYIGLNPLAYLEAVATVAMVVVATGLIIAPFAGWLTLASAWAPRAPFLWATLPIAGIAMLEAMVNDSSYFIRTLVEHPARLFPQVFGPDFEGFGIRGDVHNSLRVVGGVELSPQFLLEPRLWVGVAIGVGLVALAIRVRRMRDDAAY